MSYALVCNDVGMVWPVVNPDRCLGDADCVAVCPEGVLAVDTTSLGHGDLSLRVHLSLDTVAQAKVVAADRCGACGLCVVACAQRALILRGRYEVAQ